DIDNAILGGVASGLAVLLGWDVIVVRLLLVLILFFGWGTIIPVYLILWLIVPPAKTISQKLEMQGESVTAERIKKEINNLKTYMDSEDFKHTSQSIGSRIVEIFSVIFKAVFAVIGSLLGLIGFVLLCAFLLVLVVWIFEPSLIIGYVPPEYSFFSPD